VNSSVWQTPVAFDLDQYLAGPVASQLHGLDRHRRSGAVGNIGSNVHDDSRGITDRIKIAD